MTRLNLWHYHERATKRHFVFGTPTDEMHARFCTINFSHRDIAAIAGEKKVIKQRLRRVFRIATAVLIYDFQFCNKRQVIR